MTNRSKWMLLGLLVLVWAALLVQRGMNAPEPARVPLKFKSGQTVSRETARGTGGLPTLIESQTASAKQVMFKKPKNIFAPLTVRIKKPTRPRPRPATIPPPAPPPVRTAPPPPSPAELARRQQELEAARARQEQELETAQAHQRMGQYRFLGYLIRMGDQRAFLSKGRKIYIVRAGEMLDDRIKIQAMDASSVKLSHQGTRMVTTLTLKKEPSGSF